MANVIGTATLELKTDTTGFSVGLADAEHQAQALSQRFQQLGSQLTASLTLPISLIGGSALKMASQFNDSMNQIVGLVGISRTQVDAWSQDILKLAPELGKSPKELADAMFFITSAGIRGKNALDALTESAKASAAGLGNMNAVADALTSAMNAYSGSGLTAKQATDVLVATVREGKVAADQLAPSIGRIIPLASQMGVSFDQVGGAIAQMTRIGFSADESVTSLQAMLSGLLSPASQSVKELQSVGLTFEGLRQELKDKGLLATLMTLQDAFHGNSAELAKIFPNVRALRGDLALTGDNAKTTAEIMQSLAGAGGSTEKAFAAVHDELKQRFNAALANVQVALVQLGDTLKPIVIPIMEKLADIVKNVSGWFQGLSDAGKHTIIIITGIAAAIGPLLVGISTAIGIVSAFGAALDVVMSPITLIVLGIALIAAEWAAAADIIIHGWDHIKQATSDLADLVKNLWIAMTQGVVQIVVGFAEQLWGHFSAIFERIAKFVTDFGTKFTDAMDIILHPFKHKLSDLTSIFSNGISDAFTQGFTAAGDNIAAQGDATVAKAKATLTASLHAAAQDGISVVSDAWSVVKDGVTNSIQDIKVTVDKFFGHHGSSSGVVGSVDQLAGSITDVGQALQTMDDRSLHVAHTAETIARSWDSVAHNIMLAEQHMPQVMQTSAAEQAQLANPNGYQHATYADAVKSVPSAPPPSAVTSGLGEIGQLMSGANPIMMIISALEQAAQSVKGFTEVINPLATIFKAMFSVIGPALEQVFVPLVGVFTVIGKLLGGILAPIIAILVDTIQLAGQAFVWLYNNIIVPLGDGLIGFLNILYDGVAAFYNGIVFLLNLIPGIHLSYMQYRSLNEGQLATVSWSDLSGGAGAYAGSGSGSSGAGATYQQAQPVTNNIYVQNNQVYGAGGQTEFVLQIVNAIKSLNVLGVT